MDAAEDDNRYQLQRCIDQVDGKIDKVDQKVEAGSRETKTGFENLIKLLDERWKSMEQRFDMTGRQQQQSIDMLTGAIVRIEQTIAATDTTVSMLESEIRISKVSLEGQKQQADGVHSELRKDIDHLLGLVTWSSRAFWGAIIATSASGIIYALLQTQSS